MTRRLYSFVLGMVAITLILFGVSVHIQKTTNSTSQSGKLVIYNWGDYIDPDLITKFTNETGIEVQYKTFDFNEPMYAKIKQDGTTCDITVPSGCMVDKVREGNLLIGLDKSRITGLENIGGGSFGLSFNEDNDHSIPYFWGILSIVYNNTMIEDAPEHWSDLWNSEYASDIMLAGGVREVMGVGLGTLGYSLNTKSLSELNVASQKLDDLTPNIKTIVGGEMKRCMINNDAVIGVTFSDGASEMLNSDEHLHYVAPSKGSSLWFDSLVIPEAAKHIDEAYTFINFMLRPENAARNAEYIGYSTPNGAAKELLSDNVKDDQALYPSEETIGSLEVYDNLE